MGNRSDRSGPYTISVVVPVYNESAVVEEFHRRLGAVLDGLSAQAPVVAEVVYINDGSRDDTLDILMEMRARDGRVAVVDLSRNFGKEIAMSAGLDHATGDAVVVIDVDLQDPPELIPELIKRWQGGCDVAYAKRTVRLGESLFRRAAAHAFYRLIGRMSRIEIPKDTGDYRLLSRRAVEAVKHLREHHRYMKGLFAWIGYKQEAVLYSRAPRYAGTTKWNIGQLCNLAIEGITSFSIAPLKLAGVLGFLVAAIALIYAAVTVYKTLMFGDPVRGYPSLMVVVLLLGGVQLMFLGVLGEYLGRVFNETKGRPLYFLNFHEPAVSILSARREDTQEIDWPPFVNPEAA